MSRSGALVHCWSTTLTFTRNGWTGLDPGLPRNRLMHIRLNTAYSHLQHANQTDHDKAKHLHNEVFHNTIYQFLLLCASSTRVYHFLHAFLKFMRNKKTLHYFAMNRKEFKFQQNRDMWHCILQRYSMTFTEHITLFVTHFIV